MKRYHWLGAAVLLLLLVSFTSPDLSPSSLIQRPDLLIAILGIGLWVFYLRSFNRLRLRQIQSKRVVALNASALGFELAGFVALLQLQLASVRGVHSTLAVITIGIAIALQLASWAFDLASGESAVNSNVADGPQTGAFRDYLMLTKPIVLALLLVTTLAAMIVAAGGLPPAGLLLWTMIGGAFSAGGASALNQYIDRVRDSKMSRTKRRPLPEGRMHPNNVVLFGTLLCIGGFFTLAVFVNLLSAMLALLGMLYYVIFYSLILKPTTTQNIVIGGGAGAIPPLVGWAAATGALSMPAFFLFALVFFWTPPHFWALALLKRRDYARAGVPMLPVIHGPHETRWQIMLYTLQVVALTLLLPLAELGGQIYFLAAFCLGGGLVYYAWQLWRQGGNQPAYKMYRYSSTYLALIFAALVVDTFI